MNLPNKYVLLQRQDGKDFYAACLDGGRFHGWLMRKHPDGQWVSERRLEQWELMQVEDQRDGEIVFDTSSTAQAEPAKHHDDFAVDLFATAMKDKMAASRAKGRDGWDKPEECDVEDLAAMLVQHVEKGDPVDIANFCMMIWNRVRETGPDTYAPIVEAFAAYCATPAQATPEGGQEPQLRDMSVVGRDLDGVPQPFAGAIVLLETIAEVGAVAFMEDGSPTPNRDLCLRFAKELRVAASQQAAEPVYGYRMKMADGDYTEWRDCTKAHYDHVLAWPEVGGFEVRTLYRAAPQDGTKST